eukprot:6166408-Amphidinium_carterae.1
MQLLDFESFDHCLPSTTYVMDLFMYVFSNGMLTKSGKSEVAAANLSQEGQAHNSHEQRMNY